MTTTTTGRSYTHPILLSAGIALILFCAIGVAAIMGWLPTSMGHTSDSVPVSSADRHLSDNPAVGVASTSLSSQDTLPGQKAREHVASHTAHVAVCASCGVIESIRDVEARGEINGLGAAGGAVVGGLLGNQVGGGHGKEAMTVAGAIGGALVGNQIERQAKTTRTYDVVVHLNDGSTRVIHEGNASSGWHVGDRVRFVNGELRSN